MKKFLSFISIVAMAAIIVVMGASPALAAAPGVTLTGAGTTGITGVAGTPTTTGSEAGVHTIVVTDATASTLTGSDAESDTVVDKIAASLVGTEVLTLTIAGEVVTTAALAAATADVTALTAVATDIQTKINAASSVADVTVSIVGASPAKAFKITVNVAGLSSSISTAVTGTGSGANKTALGGNSPVAGTNANSVDTFVANAGSNGLFVPSSPKTTTHTTAAGTASTLAGLEALLEVAGADINGVTITAGVALTAGTAVITVTPGAASILKITGTASIAAGANDELTITAFDDVQNRDTNYAGAKSLTFSGLTTMTTVPTVEGTDLGSATSVNFTAGVSDAGVATLIATKAESASLDVTDGTALSTGDAAYDLDLVVSAGTKTKLIFTGQPSASTVANVAIATQPIVSIEDVYGNVTADTDTVTLAAYSDNACSVAATGIGGTLTKAGVSGVANFTANGVKFTNSTNSLYFGATSGALTAACTTPAITITPAAPALVCSPSGQAGAIWLSWTIPYGVKASGATYTGQRIAGNTLTWGGGSNVTFGTTWTTGTPGASTQQLVTGMNPLTQYSFRVHALGNNSLESVDSNLITCYAPSSSGAAVDSIKPTSNITTPASGATIQSTIAYTIKGNASDTGGSSVQKVEISTDGGTSWAYTTVKAADVGSNITWEYVWNNPSAGSHNIKTRATDWVGNLETAGTGITVTASATGVATTAPTTATTTTTTGTTAVTVPAGITGVQAQIYTLQVQLISLLQQLLTMIIAGK